jgi:hypothetical protein
MPHTESFALAVQVAGLLHKALQQPTTSTCSSTANVAFNTNVAFNSISD